MSNRWSFTQIGYNEGFLSLNLSGMEITNKVDITLQPKVRISDEKDVLGLQLSVVYSQPSDDKTLVEYGGIAVFRIPDLQNLCVNNEVPLGFKMDFLSMALSFFRGIVWEKLKGTGLERFLLPQMSEKDMMDVKFPIGLAKDTEISC